MRKVLIEKVSNTTRVTTWDTKNPDKKVIKSYNQGANTLIEKDVLIIEDSNNIFPKQRILFSELDENYGTTDIETFGEYLDTNGFFLVSGESDSGTVSPILVTRAEILVLVSSAELSVGAQYTITDADPNLYGGTEITLTAITPSELSLQGSGKFYCPKYDLSVRGYNIWTKYMEGNFSNVVSTFTPNEIVTANNGATAIYLAEGFLEWISGEWASAVSVEGVTGRADISGFATPTSSIGQIRHWGGKSWTNVNGNIGASVDKYTLDSEWQEIPFNETEYNVYIDEIQYDFGNDMIIYRKDRYNNVVSGSYQVFFELESPYGYERGNPIKDFQWGCAQDNDFDLGIQGNEIINSYFETLNTITRYVKFNKLIQFSFIYSNTLMSGNTIINNTLIGSSIYNNTLNLSSINRNTLNLSSIENNTLSLSNIEANILNNSVIGNNIFNRGLVAVNTLKSGSRISNNSLNSNSEINYNILNSSGGITNNTLSSESLINHNTLSNSYIEENILNGGSFSNNTLNDGCYINSNNLSNGSSIVFNFLSSKGYINYNTLNSSNIENNNLNSSSYIHSNLSDNLMISDNSLNGNSGIYDNTLSNVIISNNTLNNGSSLQFTGGALSGKSVSHLTMLRNNDSISISATIIFDVNISKTIFKRQDGTSRLQYVNNSDVIVITDVDA